MSHELRTPLNAIIGFSELLEYQYPEKLDESQKEYVQDINKSGKHLLSIINDILDFSKIEAGKIGMEPTDVHLPTLLDASLMMFREDAVKRRIRLSTDLTGLPRHDTGGRTQTQTDRLQPPLERREIHPRRGAGDSRRPSSDVEKSSVDDGKRGGRIAARSRSAMNRYTTNVVVDIVVTDTGIGIKKEDLERIFKPFEQVDGSTSRRYQGTGLGLSLAKRFAELHGGYLCVESEGENRGSSFHCVIPA